MSDGSLSQDEIDALLQETDNLEMETVAPGGAEPFSDAEQSHFLKLLEEISATQASNLSILTRKTVNLEKPSIEIVAGPAVLEQLADEMVDVKLDFTDGLQGDHSYLLEVPTAQTIAGLMMGQEEVELDDAALSAVAEALTQISGTATTEIGNQISRTIKTIPPDYQSGSKDQVRFPQGEVMVKLEYPLIIEGEDPSRLIELFSLSLAKEITSLSGGDAQAAAGQQAQGFGVETAAAGGTSGGTTGGPEAPAGADIFGGAGGMQQTFGQPMGGGSVSPQAQPNVQPVQFANLQSGVPQAEQGNIGLLMDVYMEMTVELGRTKKLIRDILGIGEGTIIELDKLAGEPVDILVNHKLIAKGEVVVIDENFGVRVTEIVSPMERMSELT